VLFLITAVPLLELKFSGDEKFGFLIERVVEEVRCISFFDNCSLIEMDYSM